MGGQGSSGGYSRAREAGGSRGNASQQESGGQTQWSTPVGSQARFELERDLATSAVESYNKMVRDEQDRITVARAKQAEKDLPNARTNNQIAELRNTAAQTKASEDAVFNALSFDAATDRITSRLPRGSYEVSGGAGFNDILTETSSIRVQQRLFDSRGNRDARIEVSVSKNPEWFGEWSEQLRRRRRG